VQSFKFRDEGGIVVGSHSTVVGGVVLVLGLPHLHRTLFLIILKLVDPIPCYTRDPPPSVGF
jgi:hypothetical protein